MKDLALGIIPLAPLPNSFTSFQKTINLFFFGQYLNVIKKKKRNTGGLDNNRGFNTEVLNTFKEVK